MKDIYAPDPKVRKVLEKLNLRHGKPNNSVHMLDIEQKGLYPLVPLGVKGSLTNPLLIKLGNYAMLKKHVQNNKELYENNNIDPDNIININGTGYYILNNV